MGRTDQVHNRDAVRSWVRFGIRYRRTERIFLGQPVLDLYLHDTYFVVAHFHLIMGVAAVFGIFAGTFYWFPAMFGRALNERLGKLHFALTFIGIYSLFLPMHVAGIAGNPRRYADFTNFEFLRPLFQIHQFMTAAAFVTAFAQTRLSSITWLALS